MISKLTKKAVEDFLKNNERLDGRGIDDYREINIETDVIAKAEGSAIVSLGDTKVIAGIKLDVGEPFPDNPNEGILITGAEMTPMSNELFEPGPPDEKAIEWARVVDRAIRESEMIDMEKLGIIEGEKVWKVFIDLYTLNADGNLFDAGILAAAAALLTTKMPKYEDDQVIRDELKDKLPLKTKVVGVTFAKIGNYLLVDPTETEESLMDARFTFGISGKEIVAMQKGGEGSFKIEEVDEMMERAFKHSKQLLKLLR